MNSVMGGMTHPSRVTNFKSHYHSNALKVSLIMFYLNMVDPIRVVGWGGLAGGGGPSDIPEANFPFFDLT